MSPPRPVSLIFDQEDIRMTDQIFSCADMASLDTLRQIVESQFSLEILLKHRELRLIDQELAKCQIALEQLRRCQIIPYPAMSSKLEDMQAVSSGFGPTLEYRVPQPPPWGILDGPYSRHYEKWLIPDPTFDPSVSEILKTPKSAGKVLAERSTRASVSEKSNSISNLRSQRGFASTRPQALPHGYLEPKEDKGPMILKRSTDGQMVKLVCLDCHRDNFSSAQGFINHCRIAHNRGFASHDAAAIACGEEVELNGAGGIIGELSASNSAMAGLVHPLIRSTHVTTSAPTTPSPLVPMSKELPSSSRAPSNSFRTRPSATFSSAPRLSESHRHAPKSFTPSFHTPHLSALFANTGRGGDLNEMVTQATIKPDIDMDADSTNEDEEHDRDTEDPSKSPIPSHNLGTRGVIRGGRLPARAVMSPAPLDRSPSNTGIRGSHKPEPRPIIIPPPIYTSRYSLPASGVATQQSQEGRSTLLDASPALNLSPNTYESHQAPSLISDDDGDEYENMYSESESPSSADDDNEGERYLGIEVEDHDDEIEALEASNSAELGLASAGKPHAPAARRSSALRSPTVVRPGNTNDRHVSFVSPARRSRRDGQRSTRKRGGK